MNLILALQRFISPIFPQIVNIDQLSSGDIKQLFAIMKESYESLLWSKFLQDLKKKNKVILIKESRTQRIVGFSTLYVFRQPQKTSRGSQRSITGVFSGDTIIQRRYWGGTALQVAFGVYLCLLKLRSPFRPVYWFLISKGYKTYLLMANNFSNYFPREDHQTPPAIMKLSHQVYGKLYPQQWDSSSGLILNNGDYHLKQGVAAPKRQLRESSSKVRYFLHRNPGWQQGDELACVAEMKFTVLTSYVTKKFQQRRIQLMSRLTGRKAAALNHS